MQIFYCPFASHDHPLGCAVLPNAHALFSAPGFREQVKATVASLSGVDVKCMYLHPIETAATAISSNSMTVGELNWFNRRDELRLRMVSPDAEDGCPAPTASDGTAVAEPGLLDVLQPHVE